MQNCYWFIVRATRGKPRKTHIPIATTNGTINDNSNLEKKTKKGGGLQQVLKLYLPIFFSFFRNILQSTPGHRLPLDDALHASCVYPVATKCLKKFRFSVVVLAGYYRRQINQFIECAGWSANMKPYS